MFIAIIIRSTCFGHLYAHHQELETTLVLLPHMVCNALVGGGRLLGVEQQAMRPRTHIYILLDVMYVMKVVFTTRIILSR